MPEPQSLEEWVKACNSEAHGHLPAQDIPEPNCLCVDCARAYALQCVKELLERTRREANLHAAHGEGCALRITAALHALTLEEFVR